MSENGCEKSGTPKRIRKVFLVLCGLYALLLPAGTALAGDIPEALLYEESAKVFLGRIEDYTTKEFSSAPYIRLDMVTIVPTEKIKGDVTVGVRQVYSGCHSTVEIRPDAEYLFGCFGENNFYIYEIEAREDGRFTLVDADRHDMIKRLESYLNDGSFTQVENDRLAGSGRTASPTERTAITGGADGPTSFIHKTEYNVWLPVGIGVLIFALAAMLVFRKKK